MTSVVLVERALRGDEDAFAELVGRHRRFVYAICLSLLGHAVDAEDLTQEVFVKAHRDLEDLRDPGKFLPWLRRVTHNVCRSWLRRKRPVSQPLDAEEEEPDPFAAAALRRVELQQLVSDALAGVSAKSREVLTLRYLAGCSESDIAGAVGIPAALVKSRLHEGRQQAKKRLLALVEELLSLQIPSLEMVGRVMARCGREGCVCSQVLTEGR